MLLLYGETKTQYLYRRYDLYDNNQHPCEALVQEVHDDLDYSPNHEIRGEECPAPQFSVFAKPS